MHDLLDISEWNAMTDHDDRHRNLYERPLARVHALAEQWTGDQTSITRSDAAGMLYTVLDVRGWTETDEATPTLTVVRICPSDCDPDCDADCHEEHAVPWKRHHDPATCPSRTGGSDA